jgi:hypothetical protein
MIYDPSVPVPGKSLLEIAAEPRQPGEPPEPVANPSPDWCLTYAEWHKKHWGRLSLVHSLLIEALEQYACPGIDKCTEQKLKDGTCIREVIGNCGNSAAETLGSL